MLLQMRLPREIGLAILTLIFTLFAVRPHMRFLLLQILKRRRTMRTLMQRDSSMHLLVFPQHVQFVETRLTISAFVRRVFVMNLLVLLQIGLVAESGITMLALEGFVARVGPLVTFQIAQ